MPPTPAVHVHPAAPVLALPDGAVQVGWDAPLVLEQVTRPQARFLRSAEGGRHLGAAEQRRHAALLHQLDQAGLLVRTSSDAAPRVCVRVHGGGAVGTEAAVTLARAGVAVSVVDRARARRQSAPHLPDPDCGAVALARVREQVPGAEVRGAHANAALDVVISAGPAVSHARELLNADQPHLLVECGELGVSVGPVVVPGVSACATCLGLYAAQERPEWPVLALQCDSRRPRVAPATATIAGALVAHEALAFIHGRATGQWRVEAEQVRAVDVRAPHPDCRCTLAALMSDQANAGQAVPAWPSLPAGDPEPVRAP